MQPVRSKEQVHLMADLDWIHLTNTLSPQLYRFFLVRFSKSVAEDLVQDVLLRLVDKVNQQIYQSKKGNIEAFAWGIALNIQYEQHREKFPELFDEEYLKKFAAPEGDSLESELVALKNAVALLDEPQKTVMQMVLSDARIDQISQTLNFPEGTVKSHIHRAKENVRKTFKKWGIL